MRIQKKYSVIICAGLMSGVIACTDPGQSTKMGAATGGAIGAGLGAIVGNQVGNTGTGLVIGAAGGAAAGGAIGNLFDAQDQRLAAQEEALTRREESLRAQKSEIEELRRIKGDTALHIQSNYQDGSFGGSDVKYASSSEIQAARTRMRPEFASSSFRSPTRQFNNNSNTGAIVEKQIIETTPKLEEEPQRVIQKAPVAAMLPPKQKEITIRNTEPVKMKSGTITEKTLISEPPPAPAIVAEDASVIKNDIEESPASLKSDLQPSGDCSQATAESKKADAVSDTADKLFHMRRAIRLCPTEARYHEQLSSLYTKMGRAEDAQFEIKESERLKASSQQITGEVSKVKSNRY